MLSQPSSEHPLAIALRDIAYSLAKSGRWDDFVFTEREQLFLFAKGSENDPWRVRDVGVRYARKPGGVEDARRITAIVEAALQKLGFEIWRQEVFEHDTTIISPPIAQLSAHARMEILGRIAPLLCECEETGHEMP